MRPLFAAISVLAAACSGGGTAPEPGPPQQLCTPEFCLEFPGDWDGEVGEDFIAISHPDEDAALGSVGYLDMEAVVTNAGGTWPASAEEASRSFWSLLDELGSASLGEVESLADGSVRSEGSLEDGRLWHRLIPIEGERAVAVEVRGPGRAWSTHADVILAGLVVVAGP